MEKSINGLAMARFSVNVTVYITVYITVNVTVNITVNITVNVTAPQHAACHRQPIYGLLSPVAYPLRSITPCFTPLVPLKEGQ